MIRNGRFVTFKNYNSFFYDKNLSLLINENSLILQNKNPKMINRNL